MRRVVTADRAIAVFALLGVLPALRVEGFPVEVAAALGFAALWRIVLGGDGRALLGPRWRIVLRALASLATFVLLAALTRGALPPLAGLLVLLALLEALALTEEQVPFLSFMVMLSACAQITGAAFVREDALGLVLTVAALCGLLAAGLLFERQLAATAGAPGTFIRRVRIGDPRQVPRWAMARAFLVLLSGGLLLGGTLWLVLPRSWPFGGGADDAESGAAEAAADADGGRIEALVGPAESSLGIRLGDVGRVKMNLTPYLEVRMPDGEVPFLRENTYDVYREGNWTATPSPPAAEPVWLEAGEGGWIATGRRDDDARGFDVRVRLLQGPMRRLYVQRDPVRLRMVRDGRSIARGLLRHENGQFDAEVDLRTNDLVQMRVVPPVRDPMALEGARSDAGVAPRPSFVELPAACAPLAAVAREVVGDETDPWRRARRLVSWLQGDAFTYTLEMPEVNSHRPVVDFVVTARRGHCEYFASALALMLRGLGHPARVARGFRGGDFLERRGVWILRGSHYHAWTEMFLEGRGWISLDPTPPDDEAADAVTRTEEADDPAGRDDDRQGWLARLLGIDEATLERVEEAIWSTVERYVLAPLRVLFGPRGAYVGWFGLLAVVLGVRRRRRLEIWRRESGARSSREAEAPYLRALRALRGAGLHRRRAQTPREFLREVFTWAPEVRDDMRWLTRSHERVRYGTLEADRAERDEGIRRVHRIQARARRRRR